MIVKNNKYQKEWHNATKPLEFFKNPVAGVLDESYSQLTPLSGVVFPPQTD
jgi:hypothetical protein